MYVTLCATECTIRGACAGNNEFNCSNTDELAWNYYTIFDLLCYDDDDNGDPRQDKTGKIG